MNRITQLEHLVNHLYEQRSPERADWADWLYENHVYVVADWAVKLAQKYGANEEYARAAAVLHDVADAVMSRFDDSHAAKSLELARQLLKESGFNGDEIAIIADDAVQYHSCHDGHVPSSLEGKVLAAADSYAHLTTNFYLYATWHMGTEGRPLEDVMSWARRKIYRDYHVKVCFDDARDELAPHYEMLKELYSR